MSEKEFEINLHSPVFKELISNLNFQIGQCLKELFEDNFEAGEITAKINIEVTNEVEYIHAQSYYYRKPAFNHKVTLTLKKKEELKGEYDEKAELKRVGGSFLLTSVEKSKLEQMSLTEIIESKEDDTP